MFHIFSRNALQEAYFVARRSKGCGTGCCFTTNNCSLQGVSPCGYCSLWPPPSPLCSCPGTSAQHKSLSPAHTCLWVGIACKECVGIPSWGMSPTAPVIKQLRRNSLPKCCRWILIHAAWTGSAAVSWLPQTATGCKGGAGSRLGAPEGSGSAVLAWGCVY